MGAKNDGTISAAELWMAFEAGAFPGFTGWGRLNDGAWAIQFGKSPD